MKTSERERIEALLLAERDRAMADLHHVEADEAEPQSISGGGRVGTQWAQAETASDVQEQESDFITASRASAHLTDLDEALRLLLEDPDALIRCVGCGGAIGSERLELVPWSRLCARCARAS